MNRRRFLALGAGGLACAAGGALLWPARPRADAAAVRSRADQIGREHKVYVGYGAPDTFFVAPFTSSDARIPNGTATPATLDAVSVALDAIEEALVVYPPGFLPAARCKAIFICGSLILDGAEAGGTYGPAWIVLVATHRVGDAGIRETARLGVHHELSSLVWSRAGDLASRWRALLPAGWADARDNAEALRAGQPGTADLARGFLSPYGATTAENDFNVYAELVFTEPARVAALAGKHRVVARKLALLIDAYTRVDGRLAAVFRDLGVAGDSPN